MPLQPDNPLSNLIRSRLAELGWSQAELCRELEKRGVEVTPSGVHYWLRGAGVAEAKRQALAEALGVSLNDLTTAAIRRATLIAGG